MVTATSRRGRGGLARLLIIVGAAAIGSSLACDRTPAQARADVAPPPAPTADAHQSPKPGPTPAPSAPAAPPVATEVSPEKIVEVIADKGAYPVPLASAAKRFAPIATLVRETPAPEVVLMAGSGPDIRRMEIAYSEDAKGKWVFSQATVLLVPSPPANVAALHGQLVAALRKKLGKPKFTKKGDAPLPQMGWKVSGRIELWLGEETSKLPDGGGPERHLRIDVAAPSGEPD